MGPGPSPFLVKAYLFKGLDGLVLIYPLYAVMFIDWGLTPIQVSAVLLAWSITAFTLQIPAGVLGDRVPRGMLIAVGQGVRLLGYLCWLTLPTFPGALLGLTLWGVKSALTNGLFEALVYDELAAAGRAEEYALVIGRAQACGFAAVLAASLAAAAAASLGYGALLIASLVTGAGAGAVALTLPLRAPRLATGRSRLQELRSGVAIALKNPVLPGILGLAAVSHAFGGGMDGFWPIFGSGAGLSHAAVPLLVAAISLAQVAGATQAHRLNNAPDAVFHGLTVAVGLLLIAGAALFNPASVVLVVILAGLIKVIDVGFDARLHRAISSDNRATMASVKTVCGLALMTLLLMAYGPLAQATSYRTAFGAVGVAFGLIGAGFLIVGRRSIGGGWR